MPDVTSADPLIGKQLGEFRIYRRHAEGGFGMLYLARHVWATDMVCVVKTLLPRYARTTWYRERFMREGAALAKLEHEHIVEIKALGIHSDREDVAPEEDPDAICYLVMPRLTGETLDEYLGRKRRLELRQVLWIVAQIASALQAAHDIGIVHRDLKPANVFLHKTKGGKVVVKLLDFGLAHDEYATDGLVTKTGSIFGTPAYSASEQLEDSRRVTPLSDVFSLAVLTFEMMVGALPWPAAPSPVLQHQSQKTPPAPPPKDLMPPPVRAVVYRGLSPDPVVRQQSAREYTMALASAIPKGAPLVQRVAEDLCDVPPHEMTLRGKRTRAAEGILPVLDVKTPALDDLPADSVRKKTPMLRKPSASPIHDSGIPAVTQNLRATRPPIDSTATAADDAPPAPSVWPQRSHAQLGAASPVEVGAQSVQSRPEAQRATARLGDAQTEPWFEPRPPAQRTTARPADAQPEPWFEARPPAQRTTARPADAQPEPWFEARPPAQRTTARPADAQPDPLLESPQRMAALFSAARPLDSQGNPLLSAAILPSEQRFQTLELGVVPAGTPRSIAVPRRAFWRRGIVIGVMVVAALGVGVGAWAFFTQTGAAPDRPDDAIASARADAPPHTGRESATVDSSRGSAPAPPRTDHAPGAGTSTESSAAPPPTSSNNANTAAVSPVTPSKHDAETPDPVSVAPQPAKLSNADSSRRDAAVEDRSTPKVDSAASTPRSRAAPPAAVVHGEGELFVAVAPGLASATIYIDNKNRGDTPYRGPLAAGTHVIRLVKNGDATKIKVFKVTIKPDSETERIVKDWQ